MQGKIIRYARHVHGLTQTELAILVNSTQLSVTRWENNLQKPKPSAEKRIKEVLGLTEETTAEITEIFISEQRKQLAEKMRKQANL
ncbi:helix-turn-helix domain-containing protein [Bacillus sp. UNC438CL73TsuS30]|uniref:helix-turn-helix domain-containing protein n=1 Tax=Bacillus sp. UNC438CL73TsuS30 TaxID=1340434 RepID=UPI0006904A2E|nr:helix-turn-helix transcriptional regulator [Bacillus sp. UNC438CL73TsuS30]